MEDNNYDYDFDIFNYARSIICNNLIKEMDEKIMRIDCSEPKKFEINDYIHNNKCILNTFADKYNYLRLHESRILPSEELVLNNTLMEYIFEIDELILKIYKENDFNKSDYDNNKSDYDKLIVDFCHEKHEKLNYSVYWKTMKTLCVELEDKESLMKYKISISTVLGLDIREYKYEIINPYKSTVVYESFTCCVKRELKFLNYSVFLDSNGINQTIKTKKSKKNISLRKLLLKEKYVK